MSDKHLTYHFYLIVVVPSDSEPLKSVKTGKNFSCLNEVSLKNFPVLTAFYERGRRSFASFSAVRKAEKSITE